MNKLTSKSTHSEKPKPLSPRPRTHKLYERWVSEPRSWAVLFALVALAFTARAGGTNHIAGISDCNCTNLTIQLSHVGEGPLQVQFGGVVLDGTYNYLNQTFRASRPAGL